MNIQNKTEKECKMYEKNQRGSMNPCCCYFIDENGGYSDPCYYPADECCTNDFPLDGAAF